MPRYVLLSDIHLRFDNPISRLDTIVETGLRKLRFVFEYARNNNCSILHAGDLFDSPRSWRMLPLVMDLFKEFTTVRFFGVTGQHDKYFYSEDISSTSWGILHKAGLIHKWDRYGVSYGDPIPEIDESGNILLIHAMITDKPLWPGQTDYTDAKKFLLDHPEFKLILCADAHRKFLYVHKDDRKICNTGPMMRLSADEMDHKPGFFLYEDGYVMNWVEIPHEPADTVLSREHLIRKEEVNEMLEQFIGEVQSDFDVGVDFNANLEAFCKANNVDKSVKDILSSVMEGADA